MIKIPWIIGGIIHLVAVFIMWCPSVDGITTWQYLGLQGETVWALDDEDAFFTASFIGHHCGNARIIPCCCHYLDIVVEMMDSSAHGFITCDVFIARKMVGGCLLGILGVSVIVHLQMSLLIIDAFVC